MTERSNRPEVRNPILALPSFQKILEWPQGQRDDFAALLDDAAKDARGKAEKCWRTYKGPMAVYWRDWAVFCGHTRRAIRRGAK